MGKIDVEHGYGPTPPGALHEHSDVDPSIAYRFAGWLAVATVVSAAIVYGTFLLFEARVQERDRREQQFPLAAGRLQEPPAPRLQTEPFRDIVRLRETERLTLTTYGWVNREEGIVRIPIDEAMRLVIERGLPARAEPPHDAFDTVVLDSASGRTAGRR